MRVVETGDQASAVSVDDLRLGCSQCQDRGVVADVQDRLPAERHRSDLLRIRLGGDLGIENDQVDTVLCAG